MLPVGVRIFASRHHPRILCRSAHTTRHWRLTNAPAVPVGWGHFFLAATPRERGGRLVSEGQLGTGFGLSEKECSRVGSPSSFRALFQIAPAKLAVSVNITLRIFGFALRAEFLAARSIRQIIHFRTSRPSTVSHRGQYGCPVGLPYAPLS